MPFGFSATSVRASLTTAQTAGDLLTVNLKRNGTSMLSTQMTFDNGEKTTATAATPAVLTSNPLALVADDEMTIDVSQVGAGADATGLKIYLLGAPT